MGRVSLNDILTIAKLGAGALSIPASIEAGTQNATADRALLGRLGIAGPDLEALAPMPSLSLPGGTAGKILSGVGKVGEVLGQMVGNPSPAPRRTFSDLMSVATLEGTQARADATEARLNKQHEENLIEKRRRTDVAAERNDILSGKPTSLEQQRSFRSGDASMLEDEGILDDDEATIYGATGRLPPRLTTKGKPDKSVDDIALGIYGQADPLTGERPSMSEAYDRAEAFVAERDRRRTVRTPPASSPAPSPGTADREPSAPTATTIPSDGEGPGRGRLGPLAPPAGGPANDPISTLPPKYQRKALQIRAAVYSKTMTQQEGIRRMEALRQLAAQGAE